MEQAEARVTETVLHTIREIVQDRGDDPNLVEIGVPLYDDGASDGASLDLDSLDALDLISTLEQAFVVELPDDVDFATIRTPRDIVRLIAAQLERG